jgi:hypothetical protein
MSNTIEPKDTEQTTLLGPIEINTDEAGAVTLKLTGHKQALQLTIFAGLGRPILPISTSRRGTSQPQISTWPVNSNWTGFTTR